MSAALSIIGLGFFLSIASLFAPACGENKLATTLVIVGVTIEGLGIACMCFLLWRQPCC